MLAVAWGLAAVVVGLLIGIAATVTALLDEVREIRVHLELDDPDDGGGDDDGEGVPWQRAS